MTAELVVTRVKLRGVIGRRPGGAWTLTSLFFRASRQDQCTIPTEIPGVELVWVDESARFTSLTSIEGEGTWVRWSNTGWPVCTLERAQEVTFPGDQEAWEERLDPQELMSVMSELQKVPFLLSLGITGGGPNIEVAIKTPELEEILDTLSVPVEVRTVVELPPSCAMPGPDAGAPE